jgi:hypothetical protein
MHFTWWNLISLLWNFLFGQRHLLLLNWHLCIYINTTNNNSCHMPIHIVHSCIISQNTQELQFPSISTSLQVRVVFYRSSSQDANMISRISLYLSQWQHINASSWPITLPTFVLSLLPIVFELIMIMKSNGQTFHTIHPIGGSKKQCNFSTLTKFTVKTNTSLSYTISPTMFHFSWLTSNIIAK